MAPDSSTYLTPVTGFDCDSTSGYYSSTTSISVRRTYSSSTYLVYYSVPANKSVEETKKQKQARMTFTDVPTMQFLKGDIAGRLKQISGHVGYNTNLAAAFHSLLEHAVKNKIAQDDMPTMVMIISDMEFDEFRNWDSLTAQQMVESLYANANRQLEGTGIKYSVPKTVWWKLHAVQGNNPVQFAKNGSALISGFSPSLLKAILGAGLEEFNPMTIMNAAINVPRYDLIKV